MPPSESRTLSLTNNYFEGMDAILGTSLSALRGITHLYLRHTLITAEALLPLVTLELLVALDVSRNALGDAGARNVAALYATALELRDVSMNDCQVSNSFPKSPSISATIASPWASPFALLW